jgi:hypothetical protein
MNTEAPEVIRTAQEAVNGLITACQKHLPLYREHPQAVAQVNRTAKWLLSAIAALNRQRAMPRPAESKK